MGLLDELRKKVEIREEKDKILWILDSGAPFYMTHSKNLYRLADGTTMKTDGNGTGFVSFMIDGKFKNI